MKKVCILFLLLLSNCLLFAQTENDKYGIGEWQIHIPYQYAENLVIAKNKVYCNATNGLFYYDKQDNSLNKLSKKDNLSDSEIGYIAYSEKHHCLIIGYTSGNIDLLKKNRIYNVNGIKESVSLSGSKRINHIYTHGDFAYLACDFGLVLLDVKKNEIKDSYLNLGTGGSSPNIYQSTIIADSIFLATSQGVFAASLLPIYNLSDYNNWTNFNQTHGLTNGNIPFISQLQDSVYAYALNLGLMIKKGNSWEEVLPTLENKDKVISLKNTGNNLFLGLAEGLGTYSFTNSKTHTLAFTNPGSPKDYEYDTDGTLWIADNNQGLIKKTSHYQQVIYPNGPAYPETFRMYSHDATTFVTSGGYYQTWQAERNYRKGIYAYRDFKWTNHPFSWIADFIDMDYNPKNGHYYIATMDGLLKWNEQTGHTTKYDQYSYEIINNDTVWSPIVGQNWRARITDVKIDRHGNIWICNHLGVPPFLPLHKLSLNGRWTSYEFNDINANAPVEIDIDQFDTKWLTLKGNQARRGGYVFNDAYGYEKHLSQASVSLPTDYINTMKVDLSNQVWIGTTKGIAVAKNLENVFRAGYKVDIPVFGNRPLMEDEYINCIAIDGGNRKWIGTTNGAFLIDAEGKEILHKFTEQNSSLLSNNVSSIAVNEKTGEVFFGTDKGICSFWGEATKGEKEHHSVEIFPNPVRPEFNGTLGVRGLANNAIVKFTDVSGNLVYRTQAAGGMATWNMKDLNGNEVASGVYLVFSASPDGENAFVGKVAIIR